MKLGSRNRLARLLRCWVKVKELEASGCQNFGFWPPEARENFLKLSRWCQVVDFGTGKSLVPPSRRWLNVLRSEIKDNGNVLFETLLPSGKFLYSIYEWKSEESH